LPDDVGVVHLDRGYDHVTVREAGAPRHLDSVIPKVRPRGATYTRL
jgi:hypothetical protein